VKEETKNIDSQEISVEDHVALVARYEALQFENLYLRSEIDKLKRLIFGARSERFVSSTNPSQLLLGLDTEPTPPVTEERESISYDRKKKQGKENAIPVRQALPAHLYRDEIVIEPENKPEEAVKIGEEITEQLEYKPGTLYVKKYVRPKYAVKSKEKVIISDLPSFPITKGIAGPGLLAHILISKFVDHLPFYRQIQQFKRQDVEIASSTMNDWLTASCNLLSPLYDKLKEKIQQSDYIKADETPINVLTEDKPGASHKGYHWVYYSPHERLVCFDYQKSRGREGPDEFLKDYRGILQTDGYAVYNTFEKSDKITMLACLAHARRKFDEAKNNDQPRAEYMLLQIQKLYAIERLADDQNLSYEDRGLLRVKKSKPILDEIEHWLKENIVQVLPKSQIGIAIAYTISLWSRLKRYVEDGRYEIDNNKIENSIRPVAIGRKNYMFAGSHEGANRAAMMYSFLGTCKINDIEPFTWLSDTLSRIADHKANRLEELLPVKKA